jgi:cell division protein FtsN
MPRDYKYRATRRRKRRPVSPWLGVAGGLLLGVLATAIAYFKFVAPAQQITAPPFAADITSPERAAPAQEPQQTVKAPELASPTKKPRFDFYTILPEMEVVIPEEELAGKTPPSAFKPVAKPAVRAAENRPNIAATAKPAATTAAVGSQSSRQPKTEPTPSSSGNYFLLSGSFGTRDQAERLKARLALLGLGASVQKLTVNKQNTIHRVRVGPFRDYASLNKARAVLRQHGIQGTPVMIRK